MTLRSVFPWDRSPADPKDESSRQFEALLRQAGADGDWTLIAPDGRVWCGSRRWIENEVMLAAFDEIFGEQQQ